MGLHLYKLLFLFNFVMIIYVHKLWYISLGLS